MKIFSICMLLLIFPFTIKGQNSKAGEFSLGMRSTISTFSADGYTGRGYGGQFRIRLLDRINTEWFADYIVTGLGGYARRNDAHIGWSVLFYPTEKESRLKPYLIAGHCFDYTSIQTRPYYGYSEKQDKFSSAVQMGLGTHLRLDRQFDFTLSAQYMSHLGKDLHVELIDHAPAGEEPEVYPHIHTSPASVLEGHLLITASVNIKIADLWGSK